MFKQFCILVLIFLWSLCAYGTENIALNKSYTFSPKPNYDLCTDDSDTKQLTDGKISGSRWTQTSTVGWVKPEPFVEVIIDLGQKYVVREVNVHTIGGGAATVEFPEFIAVLISDMSSQFKLAGVISNKKLQRVRADSNRGIQQVMSIKNINAAGRFVKLITRPQGRTVFMDEIEVMGEKFAELNLREDLEIVENDEKLLDVVEKYLQIEDNLAEIQKYSEQNNNSVSQVLTTNILLDENSLRKHKAQIYKNKYKKPFVCLPANPMEIVFEKEFYIQEVAEEINIEMWQNEYESAAFNIVNCSEQTMRIALSVSPILGPDFQTIDSDKVLTIRRAQYVQASQLGSIADVLVLQGTRTFEIQAGELIQIWLTIHDPELTAGDYKAQIAVIGEFLTGEGLHREMIPIELKVYENRLADIPALDTCVWDYYQVASEPEMAKDLREHHINVCVVPAQKLPFLRFYSDSPGVTRTPDYSKLDEAIKLHRYAKTFLLGMSFSAAKKDYGRFGDVVWMTDDWKNVFSSWLKDLVSHLQKNGIGYDRFVMYPFDESIGDDYYKLAQLIKSIDPKIRLYANSFGKGPDEFMRFRELIDIWCLQDSHIAKHPDRFNKIKSFGKEMWTYECLEPMKAQQPYSYYRLLPWRAFQRGQSGAGFWIYYYGLGYEPGAVPWDDTLRPHGFSGVVYGTKNHPELYEGIVLPKFKENIIPSRRWEAWREGVEDYQYLYELQQAINKIKNTNAKAANNAQKILDTQVNRVLNSPDNCNLVYEAREILTDTLQKITNQ
ncbi:MAG: hypothetical protein JXA96_09570 [Sedimentisphaerales bacterium]|nr:hypothetical protein [Sedimentisphaerales bacterium]